MKDEWTRSFGGHTASSNHADRSDARPKANSSTTAGSSTECSSNCHSHDSTLRGRRRNVGSSNNRFCLREVKKPDKKSLRLVPLLKHSNILGEKKKDEFLASGKNTSDQGGQTAGGDDQNDGSAAPFLLPNGANTDCSFPVPSSWRCTTSNGLVQAVDHEQKKKSGSIITIKLPLKDSNGSKDQGLSLSQKLSILYDQEGFTPPIPRYAIPKV